MAQVRSGAHSRTYRVALKVAGVGEIAVAYTTPSASYPGVLDTSDIPAAASDYQKQVNDRVNEYQGRVTQWLGTAAAAIQPQAIAQELVDLLNASGAAAALGQAVSRSGASINLSAVAPAVIEYIRVEDGANGESLRLTYLEIEDAAFVPPQAVPGQIVKIQTKDNDADPYYLRADGSGTALTTVVWREAAATTGVLSSPFCVGALYDGSLWIAASQESCRPTSMRPAPASPSP